VKPVPVPEEFVISKIPRFCAVRIDDSGLASVIGMSGGPILGMRKNRNGRGEYTCIAVQGTELKERRMVFGTPITIFLAAIKEQLDSNIGKVVRVSPVDIARRQIKEAVHLFVMEHDPVAIQTLVSAALDTISAIVEASGSEPLLAVPTSTVGPPPDPMTAQHTFFRRVHAEANEITDFNPAITESLLACLCQLHMQLSAEEVPLLLCMLTWFRFHDGNDAFDVTDATDTEKAFHHELWGLHSRGDRAHFLERFLKHGN
jgi:hypothetical protein